MISDLKTKLGVPVRCQLALTFLLAVLANELHAAELRGLVLANELGGPPVPNVEVAAAAGANSTVTDDQGRFVFRFPGKQPGEMVRLIVQKPGHVVVNELQLKLALPKDSDAEIL